MTVATFPSVEHCDGSGALAIAVDADILAAPLTLYGGAVSRWRWSNGFPKLG